MLQFSSQPNVALGGVSRLIENFHCNIEISLDVGRGMFSLFSSRIVEINQNAKIYILVYEIRGTTKTPKMVIA